VLVLVVCVLMVSYASSFRAYLEQRHQLRQLDAQIAQSYADIQSLRREQRRWADPAYKQQMAREKFGFVMPGEKAFTVIDENGRPLGHTDSLSDPRVSTDGGRPPWYDAAWSSVLLAGNPPDPKDEQKPIELIKPPKQPNN
jgi:cell division protein FtsB